MKGPVICIGAALVDELFYCADQAIAGTSNPAIGTRSVGGVISNVARHLGLLNMPVQLITMLGDDADGEFVQKDLLRCSVGLNHVLFTKEPTGKYVAILNNDGSLFAAACADISALFLTSGFFEKKNNILLSAGAIIADANILPESIEWLVHFSTKNNIPLFIEPVSVSKAKKLAAIDISGIFMITPNEDELPALCLGVHKDEKRCIDELLGRGVKYVWLRKGEKGSVLYGNGQIQQLEARHIPVVDSTGAGDAALAGWVAGRFKGWDDIKCMKAGHSMAFDVLGVQGSIISYLNERVLLDILSKYYPDAI